MLKFLRETQDLSTPTCRGHQSVGTAYHLPFEFVVPNSLISARSEIAAEYLNLLPTVKPDAIFQAPNSKRAYGRPMISYMLTASAVHIGSGKRYRCKQEISMLPSMTAAPPLQIEQFEQEYTIDCCKTLKQHRWSRPFGKLTISAVEPQPLNTSTCEPRASTTAAIKLMFDPCKAHRPVVQPYDWDITVKSFLRIKTFVTTQPFTQLPTQKSAEKNPFMQMDSQDTKADLRHCNTLPWRLHRLSSAGTIIANPSSTPWTSTLLVPVNACKTLLPTFLSPLAARRYVLVLQVDIGDLSHGTLALEIPIQVIHDPSEKRRTLRAQYHESLLCQNLEDMAAMSLEDDLGRDVGDVIKPPPYTKH